MLTSASGSAPWHKAAERAFTSRHALLQFARHVQDTLGLTKPELELLGAEHLLGSGDNRVFDTPLANGLSSVSLASVVLSETQVRAWVRSLLLLLRLHLAALAAYALVAVSYSCDAGRLRTVGEWWRAVADVSKADVETWVTLTAGVGAVGSGVFVVSGWGVGVPPHVTDSVPGPGPDGRDPVAEGHCLKIATQVYVVVLLAGWACVNWAATYLLLLFIVPLYLSIPPRGTRAQQGKEALGRWVVHGLVVAVAVGCLSSPGLWS